MSTANPQPPLSLDDLRRFKWLLGGLLALVSLATVFFLDLEAVGLVVGAGAAILATLVRPAWPARVPTVIWRLAVPAIVAVVAVDFRFATETLPVLLRLAVLLVLYRAVSYRRKREDLQLIVLGLFLVVVAGVLTVALEFALLLLLFTACALGFLFVVTLIDLTDTGPRVMRPEEMREVPAWARGGWGPPCRRLRQVADWRVVGFAAVLFGGVVAASILLFLVMPRFEIGSGFLLDKYITRKSRTGFTEQVRFGSVSELVRDEGVALRIDLSDARALPELPYLRLVVLDEYTPDGFRVSAGTKGELLGAQRTERTLRGRSGLGAPGVGGTWTFYVEPGVSRFLPLPGGFGVLRLRDPAPLQYSAALRLAALRTEPLAMTAFRLEGVDLAAALSDPGLGRVLGEQRAGRLRMDDPGRRILVTLQGPAGEANAAVLARALAEITRGEALDAPTFSARAVAWLQARHAYALAASVPREAGDDIVDWLASDEPGFCEYFAGAFVVLARAAGHPARVAAGFRGGSLNAFENYLMVRHSDAHAWAEIFDGRDQWLRVDPTPGAGGGPATPTPLAAARTRDATWAARLDTLRVLWYRRVVNFDARQQEQLAETVRAVTSFAGESLRARLLRLGDGLRAWLRGPWDGPRLGRVAAAAALALGTLVLVVGAGRGLLARWRLRRHPDRFDPVRRRAGRELRRLAEHPVEIDGSPEIGSLRAELERLRYGRRESWPKPAAVFRRARAVRRA